VSLEVKHRQPGTGVHQRYLDELDGIIQLHLNFTSVVPDEGKMFIFISWVCVTPTAQVIFAGT
jgi:hypothetical protein